MNQNPNTPNNNQNQRGNLQNNRGRSDNRFSGRDRQYNHDKNQNTAMKAKPGDKVSGQDSIKGHEDTRQPSKNRAPKGVEHISIDGKQQQRAIKNAISQNQNQSVQSPKPGQNVPAGGNNRYGRNPVRSSSHNDAIGRHASVKRVETVEDIQADIERIDKDIQFEIKQIKAVKLGL